MDNKDLIAGVARILDILQWYERVTQLPDCNDCERIACHFKPRCGEQVRINCPLHSSAEKHNYEIVDTDLYDSMVNTIKHLSCTVKSLERGDAVDS